MLLKFIKNNFGSYPLWLKLFYVNALITLLGIAAFFGAICLLHEIILGHVLLVWSQYYVHKIFIVARKDFDEFIKKGGRSYKGSVIFSESFFVPYHENENYAKFKLNLEDAKKGKLDVLFFSDREKGKIYQVKEKDNHLFIDYSNKINMPISLSNLSRKDDEIWGYKLIGHFQAQPIYEYLLANNKVFAYNSVAVQKEIPDKGLILQKLFYQEIDAEKFFQTLA